MRTSFHNVNTIFSTYIASYSVFITGAMNEFHFLGDLAACLYRWGGCLSIQDG